MRDGDGEGGEGAGDGEGGVRGGGRGTELCRSTNDRKEYWVGTMVGRDDLEGRWGGGGTELCRSTNRQEGVLGWDDGGYG